MLSFWKQVVSYDIYHDSPAYLVVITRNSLYALIHVHHQPKMVNEMILHARCSVCPS